MEKFYVELRVYKETWITKELKSKITIQCDTLKEANKRVIEIIGD